MKLDIDEGILDLGSWCILRTGNLDTLPVHEALKKMGFAVWTPIERRIGRMPRTRKEYDRTYALMPTYVFAPSDRLDDLLALSVVPSINCPPFTIFRHGGGFPLIANLELDSLRSEEDRRRSIFERHKNKGRKAPVFEPGLEIKLSEAGFEGLFGTVVESKGSYTLVDIPGFKQPIQISSLLLQKDVIADELKETNAKAA